MSYDLPPKIVNLLRETFRDYMCYVMRTGKLTTSFMWLVELDKVVFRLLVAKDEVIGELQEALAEV